MNIHTLGQLFETILSNLDFLISVKLKPEISYIGRLTVKPMECQIIGLNFEKEHHLISLTLSKFVPVAPLGVVPINSELEGDNVIFELKYCMLNNTLIQISDLTENNNYIDEVQILSSAKIT